jgi:quercetin dioxygenase-like cupin family protein
MGESLYRPGGAAQLSPAATETVYYALEGELTLTVVDGDHTEEHVLVPGDSVHLAAGTVRAVLNHTARTARLLVVVAHPTAES